MSGQRTTDVGNSPDDIPELILRQPRRHPESVAPPDTWRKEPDHGADACI